MAGGSTYSMPLHNQIGSSTSTMPISSRSSTYEAPNFMSNHESTSLSQPFTPISTMTNQFHRSGSSIGKICSVTKSTTTTFNCNGTIYNYPYFILFFDSSIILVNHTLSMHLLYKFKFFYFICFLKHQTLLQQHHNMKLDLLALWCMNQVVALKGTENLLDLLYITYHDLIFLLPDLNI